MVNPTPLSLLGQFRPLAHHPDCGRHNHHLVRPFGYPICLGCAGVGAGVLMGVGLWAALRPDLGASAAFVGALTCFLPTFGQPFLQRRAYKFPSRVLLGFGFALIAWSLWIAPLTLAGWVGRVGVAGATYGLYRLATTLRERKTPDPCNGCPWGSFPLCAHNLPHLRKLHAAEAEPGQKAFLGAMLADLEPLAAVEPNFRTLPQRVGGSVEFHNARIDDRA